MDTVAKARSVVDLIVVDLLLLTHHSILAHTDLTAQRYRQHLIVDLKVVAFSTRGTKMCEVQWG
jgi:hypothetical protein